MSFVELILSRREVLFSLAVVAVVLLVTLVLAVGPGLRRRWKRYRTQRKMKRAAKLARLKEQQTRARAARQNAARARTRTRSGAYAVEAGMEEAAPAEPLMPLEQSPAAFAPPQPNAPPLPPEPPGPAPTPTPTPAPLLTTTTEEPKPEESTDSDIQSVLDSVFVDDEAVQRHANLMKGIDPMNAEDLAALAKRIEEQLIARNAPRDDS